MGQCLAYPRFDARMQDGFQLVTGSLVREYTFPQAATIQFAFSGEHAGSESRDHFGKAGRTRRDDFPGDDIGVDDGDAPLGEHVGHGALAAADATGQAHDQHVSARPSSGRPW